MDHHLGKIITAIASIQERLAVPTTGAIGRKLKCTADKVTYGVQRLEMNGICRRSGSPERPVYRLTDTGWSMAGGKPFWME